jgi:hypothetical protein
VIVSLSYIVWEANKERSLYRVCYRTRRHRDHDMFAEGIKCGPLACPLEREGVSRPPPSGRTALARSSIALLPSPAITFAKNP